MLAISIPIIFVDFEIILHMSFIFQAILAFQKLSEIDGNAGFLFCTTV